MEYQKIINVLHNTTNQPCKFKTENWVKINDGSYWTYSTSSQIKCKASMISSSLCEYKDVNLLAKRTITVSNKGKELAPNNRNKKVIFKNYAPFIDCMSEIQNKKIDHAKDTDVVMPIYNLIKYKDNCSKSSEISWKYYWDELFTNVMELLLMFMMILIVLHLNINKKQQVKQEIMELKMFK